MEKNVRFFNVTIKYKLNINKNGWEVKDNSNLAFINVIKKIIQY